MFKGHYTYINLKTSKFDIKLHFQKLDRRRSISFIYKTLPIVVFSINGIYNDNKQSVPDKGEAKKTFSGKFYKGEGIPNICLECSEKQAFLKGLHNSKGSFAFLFKGIICAEQALFMN